ncbi:MFS transporter [Sphingomonas pokkalii]|uniref:MFS transporter n=1 Tax=Sphingomonas pokkalii TaxID=2175090 RepID=A0A2U0SB17_9SPHN|nr:MFS transporter [Sphingomonas pokkalii]PVX28568.1 MFS transporter [Sphingomonas pokkalii]
MKAIRAFWEDLTLKPQGFTMIIAGFLPVFAIIAMFPLVAAIIGHFHDDPNAAIKVPAMVTAPGYAIALLAPFAGLLCDRFGRRRILLACTFFYGVAGTAPFFLESLDSIIATRLALGVCEAGILTIVNTLIADYWADSSRRNWLMLQGIVGPALQPGVFVLVASVAAVRWNGGFLVYLIAFPIFLSMYFFLFEPKREQVAAQEGARALEAPGPFPAGAAVLVGAVTLFASILYYVFIVNGSIAWKEVGVTDPLQVSTLTVVPALFIIVGSILFRIVSRFNNAVQIAAFLGMLGIGLAGIGLARSVTAMQLSMAFQQTGAGMAIPALIAWSQSKFGFAHRGRGMGVWTSAFFLGQAISPIIVGNVAGAAGSMQGAFLALGLVAIVAAVLGFGLGTRAPLRAATA